MSVSTALKLQHLLEAEGARFHSSLVAAVLPSMGGGMGFCYRQPNPEATKDEYLPPGTQLAVLPFRSMITTQKARRNLALMETQLTHQLDGKNVPPTLTFTSSGLEKFEGGDEDFNAAVTLKEQELSTLLDPTNTITCYILLMAMLYGRWGTEETTEPPVSVSFRHENQWMQTWILNLPPQYDNLLELHHPSFYARTARELKSSLQQSSDTFPPHPCKALLYFDRFNTKCAVEQEEMIRRFCFCEERLRFLQLPIAGVDTLQSAEGPAGVSGSCTLGRFCWAFNSLLSRGFAYSKDVWTMIPFVDYFNYSLRPNSNMSLYTGQRGKRGGLVSLPESAYEYHFVTTGHIRPGEQFLIMYGDYSDMELLMWYGFTLRPALLPLDEVYREKLNEIYHEAHPGGGGIAAPFGKRYLWQLLPLLWDEHHRRVMWGMWWAQQEGLLTADQQSVHTESGASPNAELENSPQVQREKYIEELKEMDVKIKQLQKERIFTRENRHLLEVSYGDWSDGLQRSLSYTLSPLADTDGDYPEQSLHHTWLDDLVDTFYARYLKGSEGKGISDEEPGMESLPVETRSAVSQVDLMTVSFVMAWRGDQTKGVLSEKEELLESEAYLRCSIGALGPSFALKELCQVIHSRILSRYSEKVQSVLPSPSQLFRVIAWMEVRNNVGKEGEVELLHLLKEGTPILQNATDYASPSCARMAQQASVDAAQLLLSVSLFSDEETMERQYMSFDD